MRIVTKIFVVTIGIFAAFNLFADDGMWMPHQMKMLNLQQQGLKMNPADLFKEDGTALMSAVVSLGGGSGEFVSDRGLILTNHHVAFGAIQRASDPEHDYISDGFLARTISEEIPAQGYIADVLMGYEEVTDRVVSAVDDDMSYLERYKAFENRIKEIVAEAEAGSEDLRCNVANMYSGNQYYLFKFKRLKDVRLVYAPPRDLGNFGGDEDNWMWPRHTGDFAFLRAYVSPENEGVEFDENNVPYQPRSHFKISLEGVQEGDFTFVMGYPGRTYRNYTLAELKQDMQRMEQGIAEREEIIAFLENASKKSKAVEIKYAGRIKGLNNGLKNFQGKLEGIQKVGLLEKKQTQETDFLNWVNQDKQRQKRYVNILDKITAAIGKAAELSEKSETLSKLMSGYYGSTLLSQAQTICRAVEEQQKPDMKRESAYQQRNRDRLKLQIKLAERGYDLETDKEFFKSRLIKLLDVPLDKIPGALRELFESGQSEDIESFVEQLYSETKIADAEKRLELLEMTPEQLEALNDPMLKLAARLEQEMKTLREQSRELGQQRRDLKKVYLAALLEKTNGKLAPDANGTIRFTYGDVMGYQPRDAVYYKPITTLNGVIEKDRGEFPFLVPEKLKRLYVSRDFGRYADPQLNDVPVCFLNTTNVTGGNSGSPTLNAKGEQVGIIFDMTYESVIGDYYVIPELQRTISVDIRYVMFITEKFSGADHLLKEMGL